jgi:hypothetical protein
MRSSQGIHFFPRIFFLLFSLFHYYIFSFPFGFSYTALASTVCFMAHSMLFFWFRYELPAFAHGYISLQRPRMTDEYAGTPFTPPLPPQFTTMHDTSQQTAPTLHVASDATLRQRNASTVVRQHATSSNERLNTGLLRPISSGGIFHRDQEDEGTLYLLNGELVVSHSSSLRPPSTDSNEHRNRSDSVIGLLASMNSTDSDSIGHDVSTTREQQ